MGVDLDPLDAFFADEAVCNAKALGKFQPKAKFRPGKKPAAAASVPTSQAPETNNSAPSEVSKTKIAKPSDEDSQLAPKDNGGWHASMGKSAGETSDIFIGLETLGDFLPHAITDTVRLPTPVTSINATEVTVTSSEALAVTDSNIENTVRENLDPLSVSASVISEGKGSRYINDQELITEPQEMEVPSSMYLTESTTESGPRVGRFQPKSKTMVHEETCEASKSVSCSLSPCEINYAEKDSSPSIQQDDVLDLSSLGFTNPLVNEVISKLPSNEETMNFMEMTQLDSGISLEPVPEVPAKPESHRAKIGSGAIHEASDPPEQENFSTGCQENETGGYIGPRESDQNELVDDADDEVLANLEFSVDYTFSPAIEEESFMAEETEVENVQTVKVKRKSKQHDENEGPPARKRNKPEKHQVSNVKPKKFSHSTRRRRVNKALLETPEDELDHEKVPLRDLIMLAEHREKQTPLCIITRKKEAAATAAAVRESNEGRGNSGQENIEFENTTAFFNYQSYMDKPRSIRWSKQDTELFYEAIRQFGTEFTLIQRLFPGLSRRQVRNKYKKEERQHPMRVREAFTNRSKDLSYFRKVIDQLQESAAEKNPNADKEDQIDLSEGEMDEEISHAHDEESKEEHVDQGDNEESKEEHVEQGDNEESKEQRVEQRDNQVASNDKVEVGSPDNPEDDDEDELLAWIQYKSDEI